jgi:hypothetical protein
MLQESRIEEESQVTLTKFTMFTGNMTWIGRVTRDSWGNRDGGSGQQANQVTRVVWGN